MRCSVDNFIVLHKFFSSEMYLVSFKNNLLIKAWKIFIKLFQIPIFKLILNSNYFLDLINIKFNQILNMEGEKIKILGITHIHYEKKIKQPNFEPNNVELRAIHKRYWY